MGTSLFAMLWVSGCEDPAWDSGDTGAAEERCDDLDNDLDGEIDGPNAVDAIPWYADRDGDGFGDPNDELLGCEPPEGYVADALDCDDGFASAFPGAPEICDGEDSDCDGTATDERDDTDGDGLSACDADCDDRDSTVNPDGTEVCGGGDEDCDGEVDEGFVDPFEPDDTLDEAAPVARDDAEVVVLGNFLSDADPADVYRIETENDPEFLVNSFHVTAAIRAAREGLAVGLVLHDGGGEIMADLDPSDGLYVGWYASSLGFGGGGTFFVEVLLLEGASCEAGEYRLVVENGG